MYVSNFYFLLNFCEDVLDVKITRNFLQCLSIQDNFPMNMNLACGKIVFSGLFSNESFFLKYIFP